MKLSIVTPMYYSAPYLQEFFMRTHASASKLTDNIEFIFVNDGSPDESLDVVLQLRKENPTIKIVDLSRNFGQHKAIMTGLQYATGDYVFLIDCDLEVAPESLPAFYKKLQTQSADVVYGVQPTRQDPPLNRLFGAMYYRVFNFFSSVAIPQNLLTIRLMSRRYVEALLQHHEQSFIIAALWFSTGFKQVPYEVEKSFKGESTYSFWRKLSMLFSSIITFSNKPLIYISLLGFVITFFAVVYILWLLFAYFVLDYGIEGWNSLIVSIWLVGGINIFSMGVIGLYVSIIFAETKLRPYTIIRQVYD